jgi:phosphate/phosphite/phosphonate ABC transporter binding protein
MSGLTRIVFGLVVPSTGGDLAEHLDGLMASLSASAGLAIERREAPSYEALAEDVRLGRCDVAWLPPIVLVRLEDAVTPLGSILRGGAATYEAALIVAATSKIRSIDGLRGTRAGWVDRWSAAGFVLPRVNLALLGVDPRTLFRTETFHGSHRSAIAALVDGACDVVGTYARASGEGEVTGGAWSEVEGADVRVLATFGAIPPDVIAVRSDAPPEVAGLVTTALDEACAREPERVRSVFGGSELRHGVATGYDALKRALVMATARGIFG